MCLIFLKWLSWKWISHFKILILLYLMEDLLRCYYHRLLYRRYMKFTWFYHSFMSFLFLCGWLTETGVFGITIHWLLFYKLLYSPKPPWVGVCVCIQVYNLVYNLYHQWCRCSSVKFSNVIAGPSTWVCYHLCRVNIPCYSWFMFRGQIISFVLKGHIMIFDPI